MTIICSATFTGQMYAYVKLWGRCVKTVIVGA